MRVAIFTDSWFPRIDGLTTSVRAAMTRLEARGHTFHVFAPGPRKETVDGVTRYRGIPFWGYPDFHIALNPRQHDTAGLLREGGFDAVHIQSPFCVGYFGLQAARKVGLPVVTSYHTYVPDLVPYVIPPGFRAASRRIVWAFTGSFFHRSDIVLVPSPSCARELVHQVPGRKIPNLEVHPNGVDTVRFHPRHRSEAMRRRLGPPGSRIILSVGRLAREKDLPFLVKAFAEARATAPDLHLAVAGKGPDLPRIRETVARLGVRAHVTFLGFLPDADLPAAYASADAFASASQFETQGMTAVEAMACGTPVAAVRARGLGDYVVDGTTGALFAPDDVADGARAMLAAAGAGPEMRSAARAHAETLDVTKSVDQLEAVYRRAVDNGPTPQRRMAAS